MRIDLLRELQERGRVFWEMFPGAQAADAWEVEGIESGSHHKPALQPPSQTSAPAGQTFRVQANMRRGTGSNLSGTWSNYTSIDDARRAAREMLRHDRVARVTIVTDTVPPQFVEWVNR